MFKIKCSLFKKAFKITPLCLSLLIFTACADFNLPFVGLGSNLSQLSLVIPSNGFINSSNMSSYSINGSCSIDGAEVTFNHSTITPTSCISGVFSTVGDFQLFTEGPIEIQAFLNEGDQTISSNMLNLQKRILTNFCVTSTPPVGTLDLTFGNVGYFQFGDPNDRNNATPFSSGRVTYDNSGAIYGLAFQPEPGDTYDNLVLLKLNQFDGSLDASFQSGGIRVLDIGSNLSTVSVLHANNQLYASTSSVGDGPRVLSFDLDGSLNGTFGGGVVDNFSGFTGDGIYHNSGVIYQTGHSLPAPHYKRITAFNASNGSRVNAFGTAGVLTTNDGRADQFGHHISFTPDNSAIYSGSEFFTAGMWNIRVSKQDRSTGANVNAFGTNGVLLLNPGADLGRPMAEQSARGREVIVDPGTGDIYIMGTFQLGAQNGIVYKADPNGNIDNSWGSNGILETTGELRPFDIKFLASGIYIFFNGLNNFGDRALFVRRVNANGSTDSSFGIAGQIEVSWPLGEARPIRGIRDINDDLLISFEVTTNNGDSDLGIVRICM